MITPRFILPALAVLLPAAGMAQLATEPFLGASDYSLIVRQNATFTSGGHVHLGGLIGGNLNSGGNLQFASSLPTSDLGLFVGGNFNVGGNQIALFNHAYYAAGGAAGVNFQNPGAALAANPLPAPVNTLFAAFETRAEAFSTAVADGKGVAASYSINGNQLYVNTQAGQLNVLQADATLVAFLADQNHAIVYQGIADGDTRLVVNYEGSGAPGASLFFNVKTNGLSSSTYDQVLWNFQSVETLTFGQSTDSFHGTIFAPTANVFWNANNIDGQLVAGNFTASQSREFHEYPFWSGPPPIEPPPFDPVPEPSTYGLMGAGGLAGLVAFRRWRASRKTNPVVAVTTTL